MAEDNTIRWPQISSSIPRNHHQLNPLDHKPQVVSTFSPFVTDTTLWVESLCGGASCGISSLSNFSSTRRVTPKRSSIRSSEIPLVSGIRNHVKTHIAAQKEPNMKYVLRGLMLVLWLDEKGASQGMDTYP